jgi:hypothetical protein
MNAKLVRMLAILALLRRRVPTLLARPPLPMTLFPYEVISL